MYRTFATAPYGSDPILFDAPTFEDFKYSDYRPGYLYVVTRALASRINANLDSWPIEELRTAYKSFLGRPAHVEHNNADWTKAKGIIADVLYRETKTASQYPEGAVYLLIEVDAKSFPKLAKSILDGKIKGVSMGADIAYSKCTICGNKAETPADYCWHLQHKGQVITDTVNGKVVTGLVAESCHKISFFEISFVFDPADESAWILSKKYIPESRISHNNFIDQSRYINVGRTEMTKTASRQVLSEEIIRLPERVNFSQNLNCPICGEAWDGMSCENCGLEAPPEGFEDPDLTPVNKDSNDDHNVDPDEFVDDPNGAEVPNPNIDQWNGDKPLHESRSKTGERMSRFTELTAKTRSGAHPGGASPVNPRSKAQYDQTTTINLPSWGADEIAPSPTSDVGFTNDEFVNTHGHDIEVRDLDAAGSDVEGGPGGNAVRVKARPVTRNSRRAVSPRIAKRLKADVDDLVNQAQDNVAQVKDAISDLNDEDRNVETSEDLGAVDQQLSALEQTLEELGEVAATPVADPSAPAPMDGGGDDSEDAGPPAEVAPEAADVAERAARKVRKARRLIRTAIRILADDDLDDEDADDEVNSLIDQVEDEVNDVDNDVREVDSDQMSDDDRHEGSRKTARAKRLAQARIVKRNKTIAQLRAARKRIAFIQASLKFADEDEYGDEKVDQDLEELDKDLGEAETSVEDLEGGQAEDESGDDEPRLGRKSRGLFRRARKISKTARVAKAHALVHSAYVKFAEEDDEGVEKDLDEADDELKSAEDELQSDADAEDTSSDDEDSREAARRRARRYLAAGEGADDNGDDSEKGDDAEESDENEEVEDSDDNEGEAGDNESEDDSSWYASRRAYNTRRATNGNQETDTETDVRNLDSGFSNTKEDMMNPLRVNVTVPTEVGDGTGDADTPTFFNGSEYDQEAPASKQPYPGSEPGAYDYHETQLENERAASNAHLFRSINLVDKMVQLGLVHAANKNKHIADYERMSPAKLAGIEETIAMVEKTGVRKVQSQPITANRNRVPNLGRNVVASSSNDEADTYVDFL